MDVLDSELLQEDTVQLLWAGKELMKGKTLRDYIGKNEKTKVYNFIVIWPIALVLLNSL